MNQASKIFRIALWAGISLVMLLAIYMNSNYFFPFIFSKVIVFRVVTEILLVILLAWAAWTNHKKIKIDWLLIIFAAYLAIMFISSLLGDNFYLSFWSYIERSEGLLLWIHLFVFYFLLRNTIETEKGWRILFDIFFAAAQVVALLGLLQYFKVDFINSSGAGEDRVSSTLGNAAFLAGYLLFAVFIGLYLAIRRGGWWWLYYGVAGIIDVFVLFQTGTRGAFLGFLVSVVLFAAYNLITSHNKRIRWSSIISGSLLIIFLLLVFANKQADWVQGNVGLSRLASISVSDTTAQARLQTWGSAWQGFIRKPILGYGQENFAEVFNQYFNPLIYRHAASRVWYDRAHDIFIDHLITGGIVGLLLYCFLLGLPLVWLIRRQIMFRRSAVSEVNNQLAEQMLILALVGFLIQGLFVFESLVVYFALLLLLAYISWLWQREVVVVPKIVSRVLFFLFVIAMIPAMYFFNIRESQANHLLIKGLAYEQYNSAQAVATYEQAIDMATSGTQEYRRRLAEYVSGLITQKLIDPTSAKIYVKRVDTELEQRMKEVPNDVANLLLYMRFLNTTYVLDPTRLLKVEDLGQKALAYSPTRPQLYYEMGYAEFYLSEWFSGQKKDSERTQALTKMRDYFQKSIDLNPEVKESYINMIMVLVASHQPLEANQYITTMDRRQLDYHDDDSINRIVNSAVQAKEYSWLKDFYLKLLETNDQNPDYYIGVALSYANLKQYAQAIDYAKKAQAFGGTYAQQSVSFIACIQNKTFTTDPVFSCK